jgi:hypothetical protein
VGIRTFLNNVENFLEIIDRMGVFAPPKAGGDELHPYADTTYITLRGNGYGTNFKSKKEVTRDGV